VSDPHLTDEELLAFLLGGLEPEEQTRIAGLLQGDAVLAQRLDRLRARIEPLRESDEHFEPAGDLVNRTLDAIPELVSTSPAAGEIDPKAQYSWGDWGVVAVAALVVFCLLFPGVVSSRELDRQNRCTYRLQRLGSALAAFADVNARHQIPSVDLDGPMSFAGSYAIRLKDLGLIDDDQLVWCPSVEGADCAFGSIPTRETIEVSNGAQLVHLQKIAGGSYAYNLGYRHDGRYETPRLMGRSQFAIMADAPASERDGRAIWIVHGGRGANVLFEDGHVQFVHSVESLPWIDNPFSNHVGKQEAGVDPNDSSLGPSHLNPVGRPTISKVRSE
jgi:prepilin-type processing-associated H-X9-DG protein